MWLTYIKNGHHTDHPSFSFTKYPWITRRIVPDSKRTFGICYHKSGLNYPIPILKSADTTFALLNHQIIDTESVYDIHNGSPFFENILNIKENPGKGFPKYTLSYLQITFQILSQMYEENRMVQTPGIIARWQKSDSATYSPSPPGWRGYHRLPWDQRIHRLYFVSTASIYTTAHPSERLFTKLCG